MRLFKIDIIYRHKVLEKHILSFMKYLKSSVENMIVLRNILLVYNLYFIFFNNI